jgi:hypothetical protein
MVDLEHLHGRSLIGAEGNPRFAATGVQRRLRNAKRPTDLSADRIPRNDVAIEGSAELRRPKLRVKVDAVQRRSAFRTHKSIRNYPSTFHRI